MDTADLIKEIEQKIKYHKKEGKRKVGTDKPLTLGIHIGKVQSFTWVLNHLQTKTKEK